MLISSISSNKSKEDPAGLASNIINFVSQCVTEIPSLEEAIDKEEKGTYEAATRTVDEKIKEFFRSWNRGGWETVFTKPDQTEDET